MTNEDISDLTNSINNFSLNKEITESENSDNELIILVTQQN